MDTQPSPPSTPTPKPIAVVERPWDWHHVGILVVFLFGVLKGAYPLISLALHGGGTTNEASVLVGVIALVFSGVTAFFKSPPGSLMQALDEGEAVGKGTL